jgi:hypothetical protein
MQRTPTANVLQSPRRWASALKRRETAIHATASGATLERPLMSPLLINQLSQLLQLNQILFLLNQFLLSNQLKPLLRSNQ